MRFEKVNEGGAERADGVSVQIKHPEYLEYRAGSKMLEVTVDFNKTNRQINVYASSAGAWTSPAGQALTADEKAKLRRDLEEALALLPGSFVVR